MTKITELALLIPLFLDGAAYAVNEQLGEEQGNTQEIEAVLVTASEIEWFQVHKDSRARLRQTGEPASQSIYVRTATTD